MIILDGDVGSTNVFAKNNGDVDTKIFVDSVIYDTDKISAVLSVKYSSKMVKIFDATVTNIDDSTVNKKVNLFLVPDS